MRGGVACEVVLDPDRLQDPWVADDFREVKLLDNSRTSLLKVRVTNSLTPDTPTYVYLDKNGEVQKTEAQAIGKQMAEALRNA